jgi:hypothetical protein
MKEPATIAKMEQFGFVLPSAATLAALAAHQQ